MAGIEQTHPGHEPRAPVRQNYATRNCDPHDGDDTLESREATLS